MSGPSAAHPVPPASATTAGNFVADTPMQLELAQFPPGKRGRRGVIVPGSLPVSRAVRCGGLTAGLDRGHIHARPLADKQLLQTEKKTRREWAVRGSPRI